MCTIMPCRGVRSDMSRWWSEARRFTQRWKLRSACAALLVVGACLSAALATQRNARNEQRRFGVEVEVKRPAPIPDEVLRSLRTDARTHGCLEDGQDPHVIDASWFVASVIHLGANNVDDLIVMPKNACLLGANIGPFWIYRKTSTGFELVLVTDALGLEILPTRTKGLRDIRASSATANRVLVKTFSFNGTRYQR